MSNLQASRRAYWQQHIKHFQDSGLSGMKYCAREAFSGPDKAKNFGIFRKSS